MAESITKDHFPSQVASDMEKMSPEYGLKVAKAIENEWFKKDNIFINVSYLTIFVYYFYLIYFLIIWIF